MTGPNVWPATETETCAISSDGKRVVLAFHDASFGILEAGLHGVRYRRSGRHGYKDSKLSFSADGRYFLALTRFFATVVFARVWDTDAASPVGRPMPLSIHSDAAVISSGNILRVLVVDRSVNPPTLKLLDAITGTSISTDLRMSRAIPEDDMSIISSLGGEIFAIITPAEILLYRVFSLRLINRFHRHDIGKLSGGPSDTALYRFKPQTAALVQSHICILVTTKTSLPTRLSWSLSWSFELLENSFHAVVLQGDKEDNISLIRRATFSRDGARLAVQHGRKLYIYNAREGTPIYPALELRHRSAVFQFADVEGNFIIGMQADALGTYLWKVGSHTMAFEFKRSGELVGFHQRMLEDCYGADKSDVQTPKQGQGKTPRRPQRREQNYVSPTARLLSACRPVVATSPLNAIFKATSRSHGALARLRDLTGGR